MSHHGSLLGLLLAILLAGVSGCGGDSESIDAGADGDTDADTDVDTDTDADTDADTDTDTDGDCDAPDVDCGGVCVDTSSDTAHCGDCDTACGTGLECVDGTCLCDDVECRPGEACVEGSCECEDGFVDCRDVCADVSSDPENCGECGNRCAEGGFCDAGNCRCPKGRVLCGDLCADLGGDRLNCGGCGVFCGGDCESGVCECRDPLAECEIPPWAGGGSVCTDLDVDPLHCGGCERDGCEAVQYCVDGSCVCRPGLTNCPRWDGDFFCVDTDTDQQSCGGCGDVCGNPNVCHEGSCVAACPEGTDACDVPGDGDALPDFCTDLGSDPRNCGGCSEGGFGRDPVRCEADELCVDGVCTDWFPAFGCDVCPCDRCSDRTVCCGYPEDPDFAICILADACPE